MVCLLLLVTLGFCLIQLFLGFRSEFRGLSNQILRQFANAAPFGVPVQPHFFFTLTLCKDLSSVRDGDGSLVFALRC